MQIVGGGGDATDDGCMYVCVPMHVCMQKIKTDLPRNSIWAQNHRHEYARKFECVFVSNWIFGKGEN